MVSLAVGVKDNMGWKRHLVKTLKGHDTSRLRKKWSSLVLHRLPTAIWTRGLLNGSFDASDAPGERPARKDYIRSIAQLRKRLRTSHHIPDFFRNLLCAGETGEMSWMKEPYGEGVATRSGPESCAAARKDSGEALTGVRLGWPLSREIADLDRGADALAGGGRPYPRRRQRETWGDLARPETPCTGGTISHGNRESLRSSAAEGAAGRIGKSKDTRR